MRLFPPDYRADATILLTCSICGVTINKPSPGPALDRFLDHTGDWHLPEKTRELYLRDWWLVEHPDDYRVNDPYGPKGNSFNPNYRVYCPHCWEEETDKPE